MKLFHDRIATSKPLVFALCLFPLGWLAWDVVHDTLGTDPVARLEHRSGIWALRLLLATLAITPLRRMTGWNGAVRYRRMLGLFAFFYASVHLMIYAFVDLDRYWSQLFEEVVKRPYITVGFTAWLFLIPLALTSTKGMMRRLGRRWGMLHRLAYAIALLALLHFLWLVKADHREPLAYIGIFAALMAWRVPWSRLRAHRRPGQGGRGGSAAAARISPGTASPALQR